MTTRKISEFTPTTSVVGTDIIPVVRTSVADPSQRNLIVTLDNLRVSIATLTTLTGSYTYSSGGTLNPGTGVSTSVSVPGISAGDFVQVGYTPAATGLLIFGCTSPATGMVEITWFNSSTTAFIIPNHTVNILVTKAVPL